MSYFHENDLFKTLYDAIPFDTYVVDVQTHEIVYMNRAMVETRGNLTGKVCYEALYEEDKPCIFCKNSKLIDKNGRPNGSSFVFENFNPYDDHWYQLQEKCVGWPDGRTVKCSVAVDISELKETQNRLAEAHAELAFKNRELELLTITDKLTGLNNRLKLDETLREEIQRAERYGIPLSVVIADIDFFKRINDRLGHQAGDSVLQKIAAAMRQDVRAQDVIGRWGGEEFLIVCPHTKLDEAYSIAEKLRKNIEALCHDGISPTASFGVAEFVKGEQDAEILGKADRALYEAKSNGRNRVEKG